MYIYTLFLHRVGGSIPLVWSYFAEFQCKSRRGRMLCALATFWMVGNISVAGLAWAVIPWETLVVTSTNGFKYNSWRIFVALCGIPALIVTIGLAFLPESPKYLLSKGMESEALKVFRSIYKMNTGAFESDYQVLLHSRWPNIIWSSAINRYTLVRFWYGPRGVRTTIKVQRPIFWNFSFTDQSCQS